MSNPAPTAAARPAAFRALAASIPFALLLATAGCLAPAAPPAPAPVEDPSVPGAAWYLELLVSPDRSADDLALDTGRHPAEMLRFFGVVPGQRIAELGAGTGYTTELLAYAVGRNGHVWGQNPPFVLKRFAEAPWTERLARPRMRNVTRLDRPFDDPFPDDVKDLDAVIMVLFYHDTVWQGVDRARMNREVFEALRPGGVYGIVDHSAREGAGLADVETLHRIEESVLRAEVEAAGFQLVGEAGFLRVPDDARDWNASPKDAGRRRGRSDRFVLKFVKP